VNTMATSPRPRRAAQAAAAAAADVVPFVVVAALGLCCCSVASGSDLFSAENLLTTPTSCATSSPCAQSSAGSSADPSVRASEWAAAQLHHSSVMPHGTSSNATTRHDSTASTREAETISSATVRAFAPTSPSFRWWLAPHPVRAPALDLATYPPDIHFQLMQLFLLHLLGARLVDALTHTPAPMRPG
jgi:hypothetical protein